MHVVEENPYQSPEEPHLTDERRSYIWWTGRAIPPFVFFAVMLLFLTTSFLSPWWNSRSFLLAVVWEIGHPGAEHWVYLYHYCYSSLSGLAVCFAVMAMSFYSGWKALSGAFRGISMTRWWLFWIGCIVLNWFLGSQFYRPVFISHAMLKMPWWQTLPYVGCNMLWVTGGTIAVAMVVRPWRFCREFGWITTIGALLGLVLLNHLFCSGLFVCIGPHGVE